MIKINKNDFLNLKTLLIDKTITYGKFDKKDIIKKLELNGAIFIERKTAKRQIIYLKKESNIFLFLQNSGYNIFNFEDIDNYIDNNFEKIPTRATIQKWENNTKARKSQSLKGLYISSFYPVDIDVDSKKFTISPLDGMGYFFFHTQDIVVDKSTIIVGIENYQVVWFAKRYEQFFKDKNLLFVMITPFIYEWLDGLENEYIHFGDYDLEGINIYINKIIPKLSSAKNYSMFIPENIETLIQKGSSELFKQQRELPNMVIEDERVKELEKLIRKYKKCYEQEGLADF